MATGKLMGRFEEAGSASFVAADPKDLEQASSRWQKDNSPSSGGADGGGASGGGGGGGGDDDGNEGGGSPVGPVGARGYALPSGLLYREEGTLNMGSAKLPVHRQYLYGFTDEGGSACKVYFYMPQNAVEHLKFFHDLSVPRGGDGADGASGAGQEATAATSGVAAGADVVAGGHCDSLHYCDPDVYTGRFDMVSDTEFRTRWDVRGPAKDYSIRSVYYRRSEGGEGVEGGGGEGGRASGREEGGGVLKEAATAAGSL